VTRAHTNPSSALRARAKFHRKQRLASGRKRRSMLIFPAARTVTTPSKATSAIGAASTAHGDEAAVVNRTLDFSAATESEEEPATSSPQAIPHTEPFILPAKQLQVHQFHQAAHTFLHTRHSPSRKSLDFGQMSAVEAFAEEEDSSVDQLEQASGHSSKQSSLDISTVRVDESGQAASIRDEVQAQLHTHAAALRYEQQQLAAADEHGDDIFDSFRATNLSDTFEQLTLLPATPHHPSREAQNAQQHRQPLQQQPQQQRQAHKNVAHKQPLPFVTSPTQFVHQPPQQKHQYARPSFAAAAPKPSRRSGVLAASSATLLAQARAAGVSTTATLTALSEASDLAAAYARHVLHASQHGSTAEQSRNRSAQHFADKHVQQQQQRRHTPQRAQASGGSPPEQPPKLPSQQAAVQSVSPPHSHIYAPSVPSTFGVPVHAAAPPSVGEQDFGTPFGQAVFTPVQMYLCAWPTGQPLSAAHFTHWGHTYQQQQQQPQPTQQPQPQQRQFVRGSTQHSQPPQQAQQSHASAQHESPLPWRFSPGHADSPSHVAWSPELPSPTLATARERFCAALSAH